MNKIESLTPEQEAKLDECAERWEELALGGDTSMDMDAIKACIDFLYESKKVEIVVAKSPLGMIEAARERGYKEDIASCDNIGLGWDSGWLAFYEYMRDELGIQYDEDAEFSAFLGMIKGGVWQTLFFDNVAMVSMRPNLVARNSDGNLHSGRGPAITWIDGSGAYFLNGVNVPSWLVETDAEKIDVKNQVLTEKNAEVRREAIRKIGMERFILKAGAKSLHKKDGYELLGTDGS